MPNHKSRSTKPPSCLWTCEVLDHRAIDKAVKRRDPRFTVTVIEYNRGAKLTDLVRDFCALITKQREADRDLDDLADEVIRVGRAATKLRQPKVDAAKAAAVRMGLSPDRLRDLLEAEPWPSVATILGILGPPWTEHRVKKLLARVKKTRRQAVEASRRAPRSKPLVRPARTL